MPPSPTATLRRLGQRDGVVDTLGAAEIAVRALKDSADAFPPLKTAASAAVTILELSRVS